MSKHKNFWVGFGCGLAVLVGVLGALFVWGIIYALENFSIIR